MNPEPNDVNHPDDTREEVASDPETHLPHERDENAAASDSTADQRRRHPSMEQGHADIEAGIQDTERIGTPSNVPSEADNKQ